MLRELFEADAQDQLGAATRPVSFALHDLQSFEQAANVHDDAGAIARQNTVHIIESAARIDRHVGEIAGNLLSLPGRAGGRIAHGHAWLQLGAFYQLADALAGRDLMRLEECIIPRREPGQRAFGEINRHAVRPGLDDPVLSGKGIPVEASTLQPC